MEVRRAGDSPSTGRHENRRAPRRQAGRLLPTGADRRDTGDRHHSGPNTRTSLVTHGTDAHQVAPELRTSPSSRGLSPCQEAIEYPNTQKALALPFTPNGVTEPTAPPIFPPGAAGYTVNIRTSSLHGTHFRRTLNCVISLTGQKDSLTVTSGTSPSYTSGGRQPTPGSSSFAPLKRSDQWAHGRYEPASTMRHPNLHSALTLSGGQGDDYITILLKALGPRPDFR